MTQNSNPFRAGTEREIRQAIASNELPKYIARRLGDASRVHFALPTGTACLAIKTSSVIASGDLTRNGVSEKRVIEYAVPARPRASGPSSKSNATPGTVHSAVEAAQMELAELTRQRPDTHLEIVPVTRWDANSQRDGEVIGYQVVGIKSVAVDGKSPIEPIGIERRPGVYRQAPAGAGFEDGRFVPLMKVKDDDRHLNKLRPTAADISDADEASSWLGLIEPKRLQSTIRRIVAMATKIDVYTGKPRHSWKEIAATVGCDKAAIEPWLKQGLNIIADALKTRLNINSKGKSMTIHPDAMLNTKEVSEAIEEHFAIKISPSTLTTLRFRGIGPEFYKVTGPVLYTWRDVCAWIAERSKPKTCTRQLYEEKNSNRRVAA